MQKPWDEQCAAYRWGTNVGQGGWIRDGDREMRESSSRWNSDDEGLSRSWQGIGIFSAMESFT